MEPPRISVILLVTIAISSTTSGYDSIFVIRDDCNQENDSTNWHGHQTPAPEPEWPGQWPDLVPSGEPGQHPGQHPIPQHGLIPGSCKSQEFFPVHGDCSRYYTWVNNGAGLTKCYFSCVPGTIWDPVCYACLHPSVVNRDECKQINDSTNCYGHQTPVVPGLEPCKQPGHQPGQKPGSCNTQVFLPVDGDCSRYYIWVNNGAGLTKFYFTCVLYTIWDPVSNACLHPSEVNRNDCSQVEHGHQTTVPGQWPGQVKCGQTGPKPGQHPIQLPGQIPGSCISEGFFPFEGIAPSTTNV
ncbi:hypothetical protein O3M35_001964 [Rhynocoris fuscipes]|uniref:Chitin-binding type-2 domain-containing protein n=1 Tax=Rhynocoris fuscipes TaxID=488301 RepID=A0AAW1CPD5_9HEMI